MALAEPRAAAEAPGGAPDAAALDWGGETLHALADRALWWPRRATLCIADPHLGKAAAFRAGGVPVPEQATTKDLSRLSLLIERFSARRLVILGDLIHAASGRAPATMESVASWRARHTSLDVLLVRGNHDVRAGDPPPDWRVRVVPGPHQEAGDGELAFAHEPDEANGRAYVLCGHLHPAVSLAGPSHGVRARCFWFRSRDRVGVLPAFGTFTGSRCVEVLPGDRVIAVGGRAGAGEGEVVELFGPREG